MDNPTVPARAAIVIPQDVSDTDAAIFGLAVIGRDEVGAFRGLDGSGTAMVSKSSIIRLLPLQTRRTRRYLSCVGLQES